MYSKFAKSSKSFDLNKNVVSDDFKHKKNVVERKMAEKNVDNFFFAYNKQKGMKNKNVCIPHPHLSTLSQPLLDIFVNAYDILGCTKNKSVK